MTPKHDPCPNEKAIEMIDKRLDRMDSRMEKMDAKLDTLLEDKWKRVGRTTTVSAIVASIIAFIGWVLK